MKTNAIKELLNTGNYNLEIVPYREAWIIQVRRGNSEQVATLHTKRGDIRQFKTTGAATRCAFQMGAADIRLINCAGYVLD